MLQTLSQNGINSAKESYPTTRAIWRRDFGLKPHPKDCGSRESNPRPLIYKASGLSATPRPLLKCHQSILNISKFATYDKSMRLARHTTSRQYYGELEIEQEGGVGTERNT